MEQHKISEYIDNLAFRKRVGGVDQEQVYAAIREISSMYSELLSEAYAENERLKGELENASRIQAGWESEPDPDLIEIPLDDTEVVAAAPAVSPEKQAKELRRLRRKDLLELLLEQSKENEDQRLLLAVQKKKILHLEQKLQNRKIDIAEAGSLAEASLRLNGIFDAAQAAAQQYLDNLKDADERCAAMESAAKERCDAMKKETEERCRELDRRTQEEVEKRWEDLSGRLEAFYDAHEGLKELLSASGTILR